jgi:hypothetical protein
MLRAACNAGQSLELPESYPHAFWVDRWLAVDSECRFFKDCQHTSTFTSRTLASTSESSRANLTNSIAELSVNSRNHVTDDTRI